MKNYIIAWRNLWRNKRRTLITVASVFFAVFFALVMRSLQLGAYGHMFRNVIESYTGYLQIQHQDFWDNKTIENLFTYSPEIKRAILADKNVTDAVLRFESFALASSGTITKGVMVLGIDPDKENLISKVKERLVKYRFTKSAIANLKNQDIPERVKKRLDLFIDNSYTGDGMLEADLEIKDREAGKLIPVIEKFSSFNNGYFESGKPQALVGDRLAKYLKLSIGDTIVLIGQGYHGTSAAGKFKVAGIVRLPTPDIDNSIVYLPIGICQDFYNAPGMLTSVALTVKNKKDRDIQKTISTIGAALQPPLRIVSWQEMNELLINQMEADSNSGIVMIDILYLVIAFGIFGTVLMMTAERRREFGVLVAIGMQKTKLAMVISVEMLYIGLMGIASGVAASLPVIIVGLYNPIRLTGDLAKMYEDFGIEPVIPFMAVDTYFLWQSLVVAVIVLIALIFPVRKIYKMKVVNSLKA
jgi:putative ABC transport system permease protein